MFQLQVFLNSSEKFIGRCFFSDVCCGKNERQSCWRQACTWKIAPETGERKLYLDFKKILQNQLPADSYFALTMTQCWSWVDPGSKLSRNCVLCQLCHLLFHHLHVIARRYCCYRLMLSRRLHWNWRPVSISHSSWSLMPSIICEIPASKLDILKR